MTRCSLCRRTNPKALFRKQGRTFLRCRGCGLVWIDPMPSPEESRRYYDRAYEDGAYVPFAEAEEVRGWIARYRLEAIRKLAPPGRWLDVGCSTGDFLAACGVEQGVQAEGIDLSAPAIRRARERGLHAHAARVEDFEPSEPYHTITAFDVLEHVIDPLGFLTRLRGWLAPGGTLALTLPDVSSAWARWLMGRHWFYYWPDEHLFYYDPHTVSRLLESAGFSVLRVERAYKPLSLGYAALALTHFNRTLGGVARATVGMLPRALASRPWKLYIGEMFVVAERLESSPGSSSLPSEVAGRPGFARPGPAGYPGRRKFPMMLWYASQGVQHWGHL
jgi:2-polyprenyl-3-methyl-5-hydroxy-6-metoxy-1,4-benzoquinol methylase